jgi:hypothetical protein
VRGSQPAATATRRSSWGVSLRGAVMMH